MILDITIVAIAVIAIICIVLSFMEAKQYPDDYC